MNTWDVPPPEPEATAPDPVAGIFKACLGIGAVVGPIFAVIAALQPKAPGEDPGTFLGFAIVIGLVAGLVVGLVAATLVTLVMLAYGGLSRWSYSRKDRERTEIDRAL